MRAFVSFASELVYVSEQSQLDNFIWNKQASEAEDIQQVSHTFMLLLFFLFFEFFPSKTLICHFYQRYYADDAGIRLKYHGS